MIMGGRSRINKGSKNFNKYISSSKISKKIFNTFNTQTFYNKIDKKFKTEFKKNAWESLFKPKIFNKKKYTLKRKVNSKELKKLLGNNYKNPNLNLMTVQAMSARSRGGGSVGNWRLGEKCI